MALSSSTVFEVRTTGSNTNGGGFVTGATGTDFSQQNAAQIAVSDAVANGTTTITSATAAFGTTAVGNIIYLQGGTGPLAAGWYQVVTRSSATTITVDRTVATGTGITLNLGGALLSIQTAINAAWITAASAAADTIIYVQKGTYASTLALTNSGMVAPVAYHSRLIGYNTVHGDNPTPGSGNQPVYAVGSGAGVSGIDLPGQGVSIEYMTFDGTVTSGTKGVVGFNSTANYNNCRGCKITTFSGIGANLSLAQNSIYNSEVTACGGASAVNLTSIAYAVNNWVHKNTTVGIFGANGGQTIIGNLITNNSGASSDGVQIDYAAVIMNNTIYGNGRDGIRFINNYSSTIGNIAQGNILAKNVGYGINYVAAVPGQPQQPQVNYNSVYSNTTGTYHNGVAGANDVSVSINPFVSSDVNLAAETSPNWGLNSTASAGASLRAAGFPGNISGLSTTTGFSDIGAVQHQDPTGNMLINPGMTGGMGG